MIGHIVKNWQAREPDMVKTDRDIEVIHRMDKKHVKTRFWRFGNVRYLQAIAIWL